MYLHVLPFLHTDMKQVVEILPCEQQVHAYLTYSIPWLLMTWRQKEPGHQQP